jgi:hypothetical protein
MTRQTFFEYTILERDLGDDFLQFPVLASQVFDFVTGGLSDRVSSQLLLACLEKVLAPSVVEVGRDAFSATEVRDALLASKPIEDNADLLFGGELPSGSAPDLSDGGFARLLLLVRPLDTLLGVTDPGMCLLAY